IWTGNATVGGVDPAVKLSATSSSITGQSNAFVVQAGPVTSFQWGSVASPQVANQPFAATVTAKDANGFTANYNGTATLSGLVGTGTNASLLVTEAYCGTPDAIESTNVSSSVVNISGWQVYIYDDTTWPTPLTVFTFPTGT